MANRILESAFHSLPSRHPNPVTCLPQVSGTHLPRRDLWSLCCVGKKEETSSALLFTSWWASQPPPSSPTFQAKARPGSERVSLATTAVLPMFFRRTSRHDSSRAWDRPHHGQGALLGKLRSLQPHPSSPAVPNPPHIEQKVESRVGLDEETPHPTSDLL